MTAVPLSPYSGSWYPASAVELERLLDDQFARSEHRVPYLFPDGVAYVAPHAGPAYSGSVAATVYRALANQQPDRVVVLAFPHQGGLSGVAVPDAEAIATPLGEVPIARAGGFRVARPGLHDHSFEIQLPFLQRAVPRARVMPLYIGLLDAAGRREAAQTLAALWRPGTVFVASSDFTHYGRSFGYTPFPADRAIGQRLQALDRESIDAASGLDAEVFLAALHQSGSNVCGAGPISLLLDTLRLLDSYLSQSLLDYQTSGEITGDYDPSVSYAALGYHPRSAFELDVADRECLLASAEATLTLLRQTGRRRAIPAEGGSPALQSRRGCFVTLRRGSELLGCIGNLEGHEPLAGEVAALTLSAALDDPRFEGQPSLAGPVDLEISVLTPFRRISHADELAIGRHGVYLTLPGRSSLLLPQVAGRKQWTPEQFLEAACRKAGAPRHGWRAPRTRVYRFEAQVFGRKFAGA